MNHWSPPVLLSKITSRFSVQFGKTWKHSSAMRTTFVVLSYPASPSSPFLASGIEVPYNWDWKWYSLVAKFWGGETVEDFIYIH